MLSKGLTITIPAADRLDATEAMKLLLTEDPNVHPKDDWVRVCGVELDEDDVALDRPIRVTVRAALLHDIARKRAAK